jgi:hypothetical protein
LDLRTTRTIRSAIEIRAPLDVVWGVLTDFAAYPEWNPHIRRVLGTVKPGARIALHTQPPGGRMIVMRPTVVTWEPPHELRWSSTFVSPRLFAGEHGFRLESNGSNRVRFVQDETFSGLMVPLYARLRLPRTRRGFDQTNEALRDRAEHIAGGPMADGAAIE